MYVNIYYYSCPFPAVEEQPPLVKSSEIFSGKPIVYDGNNMDDIVQQIAKKIETKNNNNNKTDEPPTR